MIKYQKDIITSIEVKQSTLDRVWILEDRNPLESYSILFQIHNKFSETGIFNRLKLYGEISPVIAYTTLHVKNNLFDIRGYEINSDVFIEKKIIYGLEAGVGCEYAFTNKTGAFLDVSVQEGFVDSPLFLDNRYTFIGLNLGVRINITKVKRFNY